MIPILKQYLHDRLFKAENSSEGVEVPITNQNDRAIEEELTKSKPLEEPVASGISRTEIGSVVEINDDVHVVKVSGEEYFIVLPDLQWTFIKNDKVQISGNVKEEVFGIAGEFEIKTMQPARCEEEFGRVTKILDDYIVFETKAVLVKSAVPEFTASLKLHQECQYEMIESDQKINDEVFKWRIVKIITVVKPLEPKPLELDVIENNIKMRDEVFKIPLNPSMVATRYVFIQNNSSENVKLMKCSLDPPLEIAKLTRESNVEDKVLYYMMPKDKKGFRVYFQITPQTVGRHEANLIADFETSKNEKIRKKCKIFIDVYRESNLQSGPRVKNTPRFIDVRIKDFFIPDDLRKVDFSKTKEVVDELKRSFSFLNEPQITPSNYVQKFRHTIYLDEIAMEISFKGYHIQKARFTDVDGYLKLEVKDVAEKRPSIIMGDAIEAHDPYRNDKDQPIHKGYIYKVENDAILVKFHEDFHINHRGKDFAVNFFFSRTSYKQQHHAIESVISENGLGFDFLFPSNVPSRHLQIHVELCDDKLMMFGKKLQWFDNKLNTYQKSAVVNAMRGECRPMPYIIYGPPGTGKTMTVIELIKQIFTLDPTTNIIVATPSNSAANLFTTALIASEMFRNPLDFVRLVSNNQVEKNLIPDYLQRYCATVSIATENNRRKKELHVIEASELRKNLTKFEVMNYRICIATVSCFGSLMQMKFSEDHFSHVIIDEAGQSTETETLIPISLLTKFKGQVILAGDPLQLGPISHSRYVKSLSLDASLLERLLTTNSCYAQNADSEYDPRFVTKLKINYRSLPSVLKVYNDLFYNGELHGAVNDETSSEAEMLSMILDNEIVFPEATGQSCGVFFVDVKKGRNSRVIDSCSWFNDGEISAIISFLSKMSMMGIEFKNIGVITPYALQVKKFKLKISVGFPDTDLKVGTVEEFQGQERLIILVSTVRTDEKHFNNDMKYGLGFLQCKKRMNVAISRAQSMLVVFGKAEVLRKDERWAKLIAYTEENGTFVNDDKT